MLHAKDYLLHYSQECDGTFYAHVNYVSLISSVVTALVDSERHLYLTITYMKMNQLKYALLLTLIYASINVFGQDATTLDPQRNAHADSLARIEQTRSKNLSELKSQKVATKAKAEEAQRVERNANDAARQSNTAYRSERKAQKIRNKADKQAKKAERARVTSDN